MQTEVRGTQQRERERRERETERDRERQRARQRENENQAGAGRLLWELAFQPQLTHAAAIRAYSHVGRGAFSWQLRGRGSSSAFAPAAPAPASADSGSSTQLSSCSSHRALKGGGVRPRVRREPGQHGGGRMPFGGDGNPLPLLDQPNLGLRHLGSHQRCSSSSSQWRRADHGDPVWIRYGDGGGGRAGPEPGPGLGLGVGQR